jgi:hypothetical protein
MPGQSDARIEPVQDDVAGVREAAIFERARRRYGWVPNTIRVMARSHTAAELYLNADELNRGGALSGVERELIAVATAAHTGVTTALRATAWP